MTDMCTTWMNIAIAARSTINRVPLDSFFFSSTGDETALGASDASTEAGATAAGATGTGADLAGAALAGVDFSATDLAGTGLAAIDFVGAGLAAAGFAGAGFLGADFAETGTGRAAAGAEAAGTTATGAALVARGVTTGRGAGEAVFLAVGVLGVGDWMLGSIVSRLVVSTPLERS